MVTSRSQSYTARSVSPPQTQEKEPGLMVDVVLDLGILRRAALAVLNSLYTRVASKLEIALPLPPKCRD